MSANTNSYHDPDEYTDPYPDGHTDSYADEYTDPYPNGHSNPYADGYTNTWSVGVDISRYSSIAGICIE